jgi:hypothetical protein
MTDNADSGRKILVLGDEYGIDQVTSHRWPHIPDQLNVADFDTVILDFSPFAIQAIAESMDPDKIPDYSQFARLLFSEGSEVIAVGRPFFQIGSNRYLQPTWWLPLSPTFLDESGDTIELQDPEYRDYFQNVRSWTYCLQGWEIPNQVLVESYMHHAGLPRAEGLRPSVYPVASNRYGRDIAFTFTVVALSRGGGHLGDSGTVTWLPPTTEIDVHDAILGLLQSRYGIARHEQPPSWLAAYDLPEATPIKQRIEEIQEVVGTLAEELQSAKENLAAVQLLQGILYETGEEVLEPLVQRGLEILGAKVQKPKTKGKEDRRIVDPADRKGTIEVKGRAGSLKIDDVRQAHQWVADRLAYEDEESKGILIANVLKDEDPSVRKGEFPDNCVKLAQSFGICLVSTTQIFQALVQSQSGDFDGAGFWDTIFTSDGSVALPRVS